MRLQKYLSACGVCSRRTAEEWITAGRITVDGIVASLGDSVPESGEHTVCVDGVKITFPTANTYILLNKPSGYVTTAKDEKGRPTVLDLVSECPARVYPVGRLDLMSEGLLLLTDDGELTQKLTHPSHKVIKVYRVSVTGSDVRRSSNLMTKPIVYNGVRYAAAEVAIIQNNGTSGVIDVKIHEGKNHEVRNMCAAAGLHVKRLQRISEGGVELGNVPLGRWRYLTSVEVQKLINL